MKYRISITPDDMTDEQAAVWARMAPTGTDVVVVFAPSRKKALADVRAELAKLELAAELRVL